MRTTARLASMLALILVLALGLSGCIRTGRDMSLNADGSGSYALTIGMKKEALASIGTGFRDSMAHFQKDIEAKGGKTRQYDDATYSYWEFKRTFKTIDELNAQLSANPATTGQLNTPTAKEQLVVRQEDNFLTTTFHVSGTLDFGSSGTLDANIATIFADAKEWLTITMPGWVTSHQGGTVQGNTVRWELHYGDKATIDEVGGGFNTQHIALLGGGLGLGLLATVGTGAWLALRRRGKPAMASEVSWPAE